MNEKEKDKRLIIPKDGFEEEASEGLGRLNREEAAEDLRELKGRMERRVRKPRRIWLPAAAAVIILLVASTVYIAMFRDRNKPETEIAMTQKPITDTALIAMAQPITISETKSTARAATSVPARAETPAAGVVPAERKNELMEADAAAGKAAENKDEIVTVQEAVAEEEVSAEVSDVVVVEALPGMEKAAAYEKMEKAAAYDKKEKAPATRTMEDSAAATANLPAGTSDKQAAPVGGIDEFNQWIRKNIRYPEEVTPRVQQVVVVTFKISADSALYDLKAMQTPGIPFTNEAFRLLREGPRWEPAMRADKRVEEEVKISIVFK